jgi:regulatory protein
MADNKLYKACLNKAMQLCSRREYTVFDISVKLKEWDLPASEIESVIAHLVREKFLDEARYASAYARDKLRYNRWGRIKIAAFLRQKKVAPGLISQALAGIDEKEYREILVNLLDKHRKTVKAKSEYEFRAKMFRFALSRGFESHLAGEILGSSE